MQTLLNVYKPIGKNPLQVIEKIKESLPEYKNVKMSYAGRLDPLAHGVLLLMAGEGIENRNHYLDLPKTYEFTMLAGLATDTYDYLGVLNTLEYNPLGTNVNLFVNSFVKSHLGKQIQSYPPFSSKTVGGKPLFWWTKENRLAEITIPQKEIEVYSFKALSFQTITSEQLQKTVLNNIELVQGDFRQLEIKEQWKKFFKINSILPEKLPTITFCLTCSSGTYVRGLVHELGKQLGCGAITIDILRTAVGDYTLKEALYIF
ncbi:MAG: hypothetical protein H0W89_05710 [Candidatus Levybacteria bacterium]|nr:hypothetical protein [Candidatus Levybacteria bacterium]